MYITYMTSKGNIIGIPINSNDYKTIFKSINYIIRGY
jgi:hypothetical protein